MAEANPQIEKLKRDVDFWRNGVESKDNEIKKLSAEIVGLRSQLLQSDDKTEEAKNLETELSEARSLLRTLAEHVAGLDGNLSKSRTFCGVCQNPYTCALNRVWEFLEAKTQEAA